MYLLITIITIQFGEKSILILIKYSFNVAVNVLNDARYDFIWNSAKMVMMDDLYLVNRNSKFNSLINQLFYQYLYINIQYPNIFLDIFTISLIHFFLRTILNESSCRSYVTRYI